MANKGDVDLVIRARNEASKTLGAINDALERLTSGQDKLTSSSEKTGSALSKLGSETARLFAQVEGTKAFSQLTADVDRATAAFQRQEAELAETEAQLRSMQTQASAAAGVQAKYRAQVEQSAKSTAELKQQLKEAEASYKAMSKTAQSARTPGAGFPTTESQTAAAGAQRTAQQIENLKTALVDQEQQGKRAADSLAQVTRAYRDLDSQSSRLTASVDRQRAAVAQSRNAMQQLGSTANAAEAAVKQLSAEQDRAAATANTVSAAQRRAALEQKRAATETLDQAKAAWAQAQQSVKQLAGEISRSGTASKAQSDEFTRLTAAAQASKQGYLDLRNNIAQFTTTIRATATDSAALATAQQTLQASMQRAATAAAQAQAGARQLGAANQAAAAGGQALASATTQVGGAATGAAARKRALNDELRKFNEGSRESLSLVQRLRGQVLSLAAAYVGLYGAIEQISQTVKAFQTLEAVQNRLGAAMGGDTARVSQEIDWLRRQSDRLGISFQVLADDYGKFAVATKGTNLEGEETRKIFLAVAEAGRVNKLSMEQMSGTYTALTQMVSKGIIQAEELRGQLGDRLPGAFQDMAKAAGVSTQELGKMMEKGELSADMLSKFADVLRDKYSGQLEQSLQSTTKEIGEFWNEVFKLRLLFAESGFIEAFTEALRGLNDYMRSADAASFVQTLSRAFGAFVKVLAEIPQHMDAIILISSAFIGLKLSGYVTTLIANFGVLASRFTMSSAAVTRLAVSTGSARAAIVAATAATRAWTIALGILGGPVGIAITAIATAIGWWVTRTDDATESLVEHQRIVDEVKNAYDEAGHKVDDWSTKLKGVTKAQAQANVASLQKQFADLTSEMAGTGTMFRRVLDMGRTPAPLAGQVREVLNALDDLKQRSITLEDFKKRVDAVNQATENSKVKEWTLGLLNAADGAKKVETSLAQAEQVVTALTGSNAEAKAALDQLNGGLKDVKPAATDGAEGLKKFQDALDGIKKMIPSLSAEMEKLKDLAKIDEFAKQVLAFGPPTKENSDLIAQARSAVEQKYADQVIAALPGVAEGFYNRLIQVESGGDTKARAKRSSATGLGQFTQDTWLRLFDKVYPALASYDQAAKLALRTNEEMSKKMLERLTAENQQQLARAGVQADPTSLYLAHFLGAGDAIKVLLANPQTLAKEIVQADSVAANPEVFKPGMTAGDLVAWSNRKMGGGAPLLGTGRTQGETDTATEQKKQADTLTRINKELDERINKMKMSTTEAEVQNKLAEAGLTLESEAGRALADKVRASREEADLQERINELVSIRSSLQEQIKFNEEQGNFDGAERIRLQLEGVNMQLREAINNATLYWQSMGGPQADAAIAKLQTMSTTIVSTKKPLVDVKQAMDMFTNGAIGAFDTMASSIAGAIDGTMSWKDALGATRDAFLQMVADFLLGIAKMILQQIIFNALAAFAAAMGWMGPGAAGGAAGGGGAVQLVGGGLKLHSGGVVGSGGGTPTGFNPGWLSSALRYHTGGVAGLAPNEVPAVLEKGEEVLTADDPRHVNNGGGQSGATLNAKIINTFDAPGFLNAAMATRDGEQTILNFVRANRSAFRAAAGI
ncbi:tape measure protein [Achromobacter phage vB_AchrS_AchV4]|uniref:Tape measure protein n=1 Tax=Achromobacter phage vB_AchrS_AchV4 TaxID=2796514 RepID=A0A7T3PGV1_9CAUD|nr:tail length tape measure protein [Achromobacter phage vB_AchrS_AchV4]QPZ53237.1 tape measure protein [Achromobacter phage vB_AchrS_AchV4]